jgi:hypothetical protein
MVMFAITRVPQIWVKKGSLVAAARAGVAAATAGSVEAICSLGPLAPTLPTSKLTSILPARSKFSETGNALAFFERRRQPDEHDVVASRLERHRRLRSDRQTVVARPHRHDAVLHAHLMDLDLGGRAARRRKQPVGLHAPVLDGEVAAGDFRRFRRGATPGLPHSDVMGCRRLKS